MSIPSLLLELILECRDLLGHARDLLVVTLQPFAHFADLAFEVLDFRFDSDATLFERFLLLHRLVDVLEICKGFIILFPD